MLPTLPVPQVPDGLIRLAERTGDQTRRWVGLMVASAFVAVVSTAPPPPHDPCKPHVDPPPAESHPAKDGEMSKDAPGTLEKVDSAYKANLKRKQDSPNPDSRKSCKP